MSAEEENGFSSSTDYRFERVPTDHNLNVLFTTLDQARKQRETIQCDSPEFEIQV